MRSLALITAILTIPQGVLADLDSASQALANGDYNTAAREFRTLANEGDAKAQANLGYMYYVGEGVQQNYEEAVNWYRKAAVQGDPDAQYNLAVAYAFGEGITQDFTEAATWYRRAAEQGHILAQYSLGISYAYGEGVRQDARESVRWFTAAAEQGYDRAQVQLGSKYHTGDGVPQDYNEAARWYRMAADRGNAAAQFNLGSMYRSGTGVGQDYNQAIRWFRLAADQGYANAQNELASIERTMAGASRTGTTPNIQPAPISRPTQPARQEPAPAIAARSPAPAPQATQPEPPVLREAESSTPDIRPSTPVGDTAMDETVEPASAPEPEPEVAEQPSRFGFIRNIFRRDPQETQTASETEVEDQSVAATAEEADVSEDQAPAEETLVAEEPPAVEETAVEQERAPRFGFIRNIFHRDQQEESTETPATEPAIEDRSMAAATEPEVIEEEPQAEELPSPEEAPVEAEPAVEQERPSRFGFIRNIFRRDPGTEEANDPGTVNEETVAIAEETPEPSYQEEESEPITEPAEDTRAAETRTRPGLLGRFFNRGERESEESSLGEEEGTVSDLGYAERDAEFTATADQIDTARMALLDRDYAKAFEEFSSLANQGDRASQYELASLYYQGLGTERSYTEAAQWYQRAAEQGDGDAQYSLGNMYLMGEGIEQSDSKAAYWYRKAADQGHEEARNNLENIARVAEITSNQPEPERELTPAESAYENDEEEVASEAAGGEERSRFGFIKNIFKRGEGNKEPVAEAAPPPEPVTEPEPEADDSGEKKGILSRWFGKDDEEDAGETEEMAAVDYDRAEVDEAMDILEGSATPEQEARVIAVADYEKGLSYSFGEGVEKDGAEAFRWFLKSAEQGYAPAQYKVGAAYAYGDGVAADAVEAASWYRKAAQQGYALAQRNLGVMYSRGEGLEQDKPLALAWYSVLAESGNVMDIRRRDQLESELTAEERQRAMEILENLKGSINTTRD